MKTPQENMINDLKELVGFLENASTKNKKGFPLPVMVSRDELKLIVSALKTFIKERDV